MSKHGSSHNTKSKKQVGLLLSKGSPLNQAQKGKLKRELESRTVRVKDGNQKRKR